MINTAIIGLGSNIHPQGNIKKAKFLISRTFHIAAESRWVKTRPIGMKGQPDFLNGAVLIHCRQDKSALKRELNKIERALGRPINHPIHGSRTIDLDILVFNGTFVDRRSCRMDFVLRSIEELMPGLF